MANGVIRTKTGAQNGNTRENDGTLQEFPSDGTEGRTYSFQNQTIPGIEANADSDVANVSFTPHKDEDGNLTALEVQAL